MLHKLRREGHHDQGFTLVELAVVILIIGVLGAVAGLSILNQKTKTTDASARELARTAETVAETIATEHHGSYTAIKGPATIASWEPTVPTSDRRGRAYLSGAWGSARSYIVTATSPSGDMFTVTREGTGEITRTCTVPAGTSGAAVGGCEDLSGTSGTW